MQNNLIEFLTNSSWLNKSNEHYIELLYTEFLKNPDLVNIHWQKNFFDLGNNSSNDNYQILNTTLKEKNVSGLVNVFRTYGFKFAKLNPLSLYSNKKNQILKLSDYLSDKNYLEDNYLSNFFEEKLSTSSNFDNFYKKLKKTYCSSIGFEYMHMDNIKEKLWISEQIEKKTKPYINKQKDKINLLTELIHSELLEKYLNYKFPGSKRFSLEGSDVIIPMLKETIRYAQKKFIPKIILGMAHRGRLNVLINILNKKPRQLFDEFIDNKQHFTNSGDVKYHLGMSSLLPNKNFNVCIELRSNPSHLEIIGPVIMGSARSYLDNNNQKNSNKILPIVIHGDASISGQGIVQESLNMSQTRGYTVGGVIHLIINNQIGFTTSTIKDLRSSFHCTDISKMIQSPVFHVNADDPEASIFVMKLALKFRSIFKKDVFINLISYRRNGHNEADDPTVTQPLMYKKIKQHPSVKNIYLKKLISLDIVDVLLENKITKKYQKFLDIEYSLCNLNEKENKGISILNKSNQITLTKKNHKIDKNKLSKLAHIINTIPSTINVHTKIKKIYSQRILMAKGIQPFDWGCAELLAYATLISNGISCRLSGEDTSRGTFFHRNAIIYDQCKEYSYIPLKKLDNLKAQFNIWNSVLSEEGVLAFEYGYSSTSKNTLTIWEAQFGDFSNVAQTVIDQFISSSEQKWNETCNLTLFLPHGYEGQGPEHSSSRLERFLQLCSQENMQITVPTTSAQIYHLLRRQAFNNVKKPLIILTPKSMLRNPLTFSSLDELSSGNFKKVINEIDNTDSFEIKRIIFCSGKIYFDLLSERRKQKITNIILIRIEELYPFPKIDLLEIKTLFSYIKTFFWCQEEPLNQGAWNYIKDKLHAILPSNSTLKCISRPHSAAPAVGSKNIHDKQQSWLIKTALNIRKKEVIKNEL